MNIFLLLDRSARRFPDLGAVYSDIAATATFSELRRRALGLAAALRGRAPAGSRVAIFSENRPDYVETMFGIWAAGMAAVPVNAKLHARELAQILSDSGAALVFVSPKLAASVHAMVAEQSLPCTVVELGGSAFAEMLAATPLESPVERAQDDLAWLFFTSGTTGRSKGAMLTHRNLMTMTVQHLADIEALDETCSVIHAAPMSHGSGIYILPYVARGARQVVPASGGFDPAEFLALCDEHPACGAFLAPTMVQRLRQHAEASGSRPANLRSIVYGGGPMYVEELRRAIAVFGQVFVQIYGQGEAPMTITGLSRADHARLDEAILGSVGQPRSGVEVRIAGPAGETLAPGEIGEVVCRGDIVMGGYWNNPAATAETLREGWLWTGDMGSIDERGYLTLRDRSKDVVISGGTNIYPREVEEALLTHPAVAEVSVIGTPHPEWGEIVVAILVAEDMAPEPADLDAHLNARIARFKRPKRYVVVEGLPKNNYGKVLKRELRQMLERGEIG